jgi:hypothetical protein
MKDTKKLKQLIDKEGLNSTLVKSIKDKLKVLDNDKTVNK